MSHPDVTRELGTTASVMRSVLSPLRSNDARHPSNPWRLRICFGNRPYCVFSTPPEKHEISFIQLPLFLKKRNLPLSLSLLLNPCYCDRCLFWLQIFLFFFKYHPLTIKSQKNGHSKLSPIRMHRAHGAFHPPSGMELPKRRRNVGVFT